MATGVVLPSSLSTSARLRRASGSPSVETQGPMPISRSPESAFATMALSLSYVAALLGTFVQSADSALGRFFAWPSSSWASAAYLNLNRKFPGGGFTGPSAMAKSARRPGAGSSTAALAEWVGLESARCRSRKLASLGASTGQSRKRARIFPTPNRDSQHTHLRLVGGCSRHYDH